MRRVQTLRTIAIAVSILGLALLAVGPEALACDGATCPPDAQYSGRAIGVFAHFTSGVPDLRVADTGDLPPEGGFIDATFASVSTPVVAATVFLSVTMGFDGVARSEVAAADVVLLPGSVFEIRADFARTHTRATCDGVWGNSEVVDLTVGGAGVPVTGAPNQVVSVPGAFTLVINEQESSSSNGCNSITVTALHLWVVPTGTEVVVSQAHSDITCVDGDGNPPEPQAKDFVTGGGFIWVGEEKGNFGFVAGYKPGRDDRSGNLNYIDHNDGMHVKATSVDTYGGSGNSRTFTGDATIDGVPGYTYTCYVEDYEEPGREDYFRLTLSTGYNAEGYLGGGNIQLHV